MKKIVLTIVILVAASFSFAGENVVYETEWIGSKEMEEVVGKMDENRLFPCRVEGRLDGIKIKYKGLYCPFPKGMVYFYSRWGMSDEWYDSYTQEYTEKGMREYSRTQFTDLSGNTVHQATWVLMNDEP